MKSIKLKLVILYITLVFIVMIVSGTIMLMNVKKSETETSESELKEYATKINATHVQKRKTFDEIQEGFKNSESISNSNIIVQILLTDGTIVVPTNISSETTATSKVVIDAITDKQQNTDGYFKYGQKYTGADGVKVWNEYALKVKVQDTDLEYIIYTRVDADPMLGRLALMTNTITIASAVAMLLTAIIGFLFAGTLTAPISRLTKKAKELADKNQPEGIPVIDSSNTRLTVNSSDEIGQLTESFNHMSQQLSSTISYISSEKNKMEIVLHNMTDGVLGYNKSGNSIHANDLCQELLGITNIDKIPFKEMTKKLGIEIDDLNELHIDTLKESTTKIGDKFISAILTTYTNKYEDVEGIVIVLQDVTKFKKLDNMRKEFVANVSHEIRTPLTTIKTYTETLIDGALDDKDLALSFLNVIESESDRMTLLVQDLLELSRFDNEQLKLDLKDADLVSLIKECLIQNKLAGEKKQQDFIFDCNQEIIIHIDRGRINQVFSNIIGNAVKYSTEKGTILITIENLEKYCYVTIKDSGMGIPKEDIPFIFERFYRVDKARSRAMGGTGLGLSIAKEIMKAHNGKITVTSEHNIGTTVTLRFNKNFKGMYDEYSV